MNSFKQINRYILKYHVIRLVIHYKTNLFISYHTNLVLFLDKLVSFNISTGIRKMACALPQLVNAVKSFKENKTSIEDFHKAYIEFMKIDIGIWVTDDIMFNNFILKVTQAHSNTCTTCEECHIKVRIFYSILLK